MPASQNNPSLTSIHIAEVTRYWAEQQKISAKYFPSIDSTNLKAKAEAFNETSFNQHLIIYLADHQTAGKGRSQNSWLSTPPGSQLLSTWSFRIDRALHQTISPMMGLAIYRATTATWPLLNWNLKAPNDLYLHDKKVAGLLLETLSQGEQCRLLLGLGFNIIATPESLTTATSLTAALAKEAPLQESAWISFLERLLFEFSFSLRMSFEPMSATNIQALLSALNKHPLLKEKYLALDENGNLSTASKKISWMEL